MCSETDLLWQTFSSLSFYQVRNGVPRCHQPDMDSSLWWVTTLHRCSVFISHTVPASFREEVNCLKDINNNRAKSKRKEKRSSPFISSVVTLDGGELLALIYLPRGGGGVITNEVMLSSSKVRKHSPRTGMIYRVSAVGNTFTCSHLQKWRLLVWFCFFQPDAFLTITMPQQQTTICHALLSLYFPSSFTSYPLHRAEIAAEQCNNFV